MPDIPGDNLDAYAERLRAAAFVKPIPWLAPQRAIVYLTFLSSNPAALVTAYAPHLKGISESLHRAHLIKRTTADRFHSLEA
ncbi:MAG: hypothetical protein NTU41_01515 [Chloroflexi bacterium]|nr:hypothetical protein [Chloroflexota bacterium]